MDKNDIRSRMQKSMDALKHEFAGLRTGRASVDLLAPVQVEAYGAVSPLSQVASVAVVDARMLSVQVWDRGLVGAVERGIRDAGLGLNPSSDGQVVRVPLPELNEQRRQELIKVARRYAEEGRVAVRNVRRDAMDAIKKAQKDSEISEDEARRQSDEVQKMTDDFVAQVDTALAAKEKDIMQV